MDPITASNSLRLRTDLKPATSYHCTWTYLKWTYGGGVKPSLQKSKFQYHLNTGELPLGNWGKLST
eukprot:1366385-Rhodomonas_salina.1